MLSPEFSSAVKSGNLLRVRIMMKDSLIVDPTFAQFNKMLAYARRDLPGLIVPHDGDALEIDQAKWDKDLMNTELVEIVNNFSDVRIEHLKKVISVVLADKIKPTVTSKEVPLSSQQHQKKAAWKQTLSQITNNSQKIEKVISTVQRKGWLDPTDIYEIEKAANQILKTTQNYKNNK